MTVAINGISFMLTWVIASFYNYLFNKAVLISGYHAQCVAGP